MDFAPCTEPAIGKTIDGFPWDPGAECEGLGHYLARDGRVGQDIFHARIRHKGFARHFDNFRFGRMVRLGEGVNLQAAHLLCDALEIISVLGHPTHVENHVPGIGLDLHIAFGNRLVVTRGQQEILSAFSLVLAKRTDIFQRLLPEIIDDTQQSRGSQKHHRPILKIDGADHINGVIVGRKQYILRRPCPFGHQCGVIVNSQFPEDVPDHAKRCHGHGPHIALYGPLVMHLIVKRLSCFRGRIAVFELKDTTTRFESLRH